MVKKVRKDRSDMTVKTFEEKHGVPPGTMRSKSGGDLRGDKLLKTVRKDAKKK
jgi:hypothetical protein